MEAVKGWLKSTGRFLVDYLELLFAGVLGVLAGILGLVGAIHGDHLTEVTVGLLGVLAFGVVRERVQRHRLGKRIDLSVALATAAHPWQVLNEELTWDLEKSDGSLATASLRNELLITQDQVLAYFEYAYAGPAGTADPYVHGRPERRIDPAPASRS